MGGYYMILSILAGCLILKVTSLNADICYDVEYNCQQWMNHCNDKDNRWHDFLKTNCALTCNLCDFGPPKKQIQVDQKGDCKDFVEDCGQFKSFCNYNQLWSDYMKKFCPKTCNHCSAVKITQTKVKVEDCYDLSTNCQTQIQNCRRNALWIDYMKRECKYTCGFCNVTPTETTHNGCYDQSSNCNDFLGFCHFDGNWIRHMKQYCTRTCGFCPIEVTKPTTLTTKEARPTTKLITTPSQTTVPTTTTTTKTTAAKLTTIKTEKPTTEKTCEDKTHNCRNVKFYCNDKNWTFHLRRVCPKTCNFC